MLKSDPLKIIAVILLILCMGMTYSNPFIFAEDGSTAEANNKTDITQNTIGEYNSGTESEDENEEKGQEENAETKTELRAAADADNDAFEAVEEPETKLADESLIEGVTGIIEEPVTEDIAFNASKADYLGYDPLFIAKYADPRYVNVEEVDMSRFYRLPAAAKGIATYNVKKQSDFDVTEKNYIAGLTYEMPVYNVDDESKYYVCVPNVNKFNSNFAAYDIDVAYNNDYAEMISGYKYEKGILYIPKSAIDSPKNKKDVPKGCTIAVQMNYAIGGDMDFSKRIPAQILSSDEPQNKTVQVSNIFDVDNLTISTGIKGRKASDISVYLNGNLIPINDDSWEYNISTGEIDIKAAPGVVSNINIIFQPGTIGKKVKDITTSAIETVIPSSYAAVSMDKMSYFRTDGGVPIELDIRSGDIFVGWRGHYSGKYIHGNKKQSQMLAKKGYENSVKYLYGGYTTSTGASESSNALAPLWAISSYAIAYNMDNDSKQGSLDQSTMVTHKNTLNGKTESKTMYEWMLAYRNQLEKSNLTYGGGKGNSIGGSNNFAITLPKVVKGSETTLVSSGENAGRSNKTIQILSDEISAEQGSNSTSVYYDYWIAAGCNHLDMAEDDDLDAKDNDIYVTCLGLGSDYAVLAFVQSNGGSYTQNACGIYKFKLAPSAYVKVKKTQANTGIDFLSEAPNNYSLAGAEYRLYTNEACTAAAKDVNGADAKMTTDAGGNTRIVEMEPGKYWVKETKASKGFRTDENASKTAIVLTEDNTENNPYIIKSDERPAYSNVAIEVEKTSKKYGVNYLVGAEYKLSYYDIEPGADPEGKKPKRSWIVKISAKKINNAQYKASLSFATDNPEPGSDDPYLIDDSRILPVGVFSVEEYRAPDGMALDAARHGGKIFQESNGSDAKCLFYETNKDNIVINNAGIPTMIHLEYPQSIILEIQKKDSETGGAAQGTNRSSVNGSLAGAVYNVYYDNDDLSEPEYVGSITTDESGKGSLSKRETGTERGTKDTELVPGTYLIEEVQASPGYTVDKNNYQEEKGKFEEGKHVIRARVKESQKSTFTYTTESLEAPHHTVISKKDIMTGKELPGATLQLMDSNGNIIEEWISSDEPHDIACLHDETQGIKDGKYTLREITAPYGYDIAEDVEFVVKSSVIVNKVEMKNRPLEIGTTALDEAEGSHHGSFSEEEIIKDTVKIKGLYIGRTYLVKGKIVDKSTGLPLLDKDGNEATAESEEFVADGDTANIELRFSVDSSKFTKDSSIVAFEKLYRISAVNDEDVPIEIAKHEDLNDESQSIRYGGVAWTVASDKKDGDHNIVSGKKAVVSDNVRYSNLSTEESYFLSGTLYDKTTGQLTEISGRKEFIPDSESGEVQVEFEFDATELEGHSLVVFEYLFNRGKMIDKHDDADNEDQTVHFKAGKRSPDTGDVDFLIFYSLISVMAMAGLTITLHLRNKLV